MSTARRAGISGLAVTMVAGGGFLVYAGIRNVPILDGLRELAGGRLPAPRPVQPTQVAFTAVDTLNPPGSDGTTDKLNPPQTNTLYRYNLGPVRAQTEKVAYAVGPRFGIKTIGGWRKLDAFPDHPTGHAVDFMINNIPNGHSVGAALAAYLVANAAALKVDYVIWDHQVWTRAKGWHHYSGSNHTDHVHATIDFGKG